MVGWSSSTTSQARANTCTMKAQLHPWGPETRLWPLSSCTAGCKPHSFSAPSPLPTSAPTWNDRCGKSRFSAHTQSCRSGGTLRFCAGLMPFSRHLRAWITKSVTPPRSDTVWTKAASWPYESASSTPSLCFGREGKGDGSAGVRRCTAGVVRRGAGGSDVYGWDYKGQLPGGSTLTCTSLQGTAQPLRTQPISSTASQLPNAPQQPPSSRKHQPTCT